MKLQKKSRMHDKNLWLKWSTKIKLEGAFNKVTL